MLAKDYNVSKSIDLTNYLWSEKLDGVRAIYDKHKELLLTRNNKIIYAPDFFMSCLKNLDLSLDGELWIDRNSFEKTSSIVRKKNANNDEWSLIKYMIFDIYESKDLYETRYEILKKLEVELPPFFKIVEHNILDKDPYDILKNLQNNNNNMLEGIMLRHKRGPYIIGRSDYLLKVKTYSDEEGTILELIPGTGRLKNTIGSVMVRNKAGKIFKIGSGFDDEARSKLKIGSIITYKYNGYTYNDIPRFATFIRFYTD